MISWFLKAIGHNAWVEIIPDWETEQEIDSTLMSIWSVVDRASLQWQKNCINTIKKSIKYISPDSKWNTIDEDMSLRLLRLTSDFSSDDMQELVAKILAWEYNQPWTFSLKTLDVVKNLSKKDIELFQKFCWFVFDCEFFFKNPFNSGSPYLNILYGEWVWYKQLIYLQDLWLVWNRNTTIPMWDKDDSETKYNYKFSIQNKDLIFEKKWYFTIHDISSLTRAWKELLTVTWFIKNDKLVEITKECFKEIFK